MCEEKLMTNEKRTCYGQQQKRFSGTHGKLFIGRWEEEEKTKLDILITKKNVEKGLIKITCEWNIDKNQVLMEN
jgi:hypothetical protein